MAPLRTGSRAQPIGGFRTPGSRDSPSPENKPEGWSKPGRPRRISRRCPSGCLRLDAYDWIPTTRVVELSGAGRNPPMLTWIQARTRSLELPRGTERPCASDDRQPEHLYRAETIAGRTPPVDVGMRRSPWDWVLPHVDYAPHYAQPLNRQLLCWFPDFCRFSDFCCFSGQWSGTDTPRTALRGVSVRSPRGTAMR